MVGIFPNFPHETGQRRRIQDTLPHKNTIATGQNATEPKTTGRIHLVCLVGQPSTLTDGDSRKRSPVSVRRNESPAGLVPSAMSTHISTSVRVSPSCALPCSAPTSSLAVGERAFAFSVRAWRACVWRVRLASEACVLHTFDVGGRCGFRKIGVLSCRELRRKCKTLFDILGGAKKRGKGWVPSEGLGLLIIGVVWE
jgi:hypothetical protein